MIPSFLCFHMVWMLICEGTDLPGAAGVEAEVSLQHQYQGLITGARSYRQGRHSNGFSSSRAGKAAGVSLQAGAP